MRKRAKNHANAVDRIFYDAIKVLPFPMPPMPLFLANNEDSLHAENK